MWYLPMTNRLRHIFLHPKEAALMTWWDDERKVDDDVIAHPADGSQWQDFDNNNPLFSSDPRNVRFSLSTDGVNSFNDPLSIVPPKKKPKHVVIPRKQHIIELMASMMLKLTISTIRCCYSQTLLTRSVL